MTFFPFFLLDFECRSADLVQEVVQESKGVGLSRNTIFGWLRQDGLSMIHRIMCLISVPKVNMYDINVPSPYLLLHSQSRSLAYERAREGESGDLPNSPPTTVETVSVICRG